jgi:hypothetical protein
MPTGIAIGPAGDVWVINNWQDIDSCFGLPPEPVSTRCGGQRVVVFFGMAKPVRVTPMLALKLTKDVAPRSPLKLEAYDNEPAASGTK